MQTGMRDNSIQSTRGWGFPTGGFVSVCRVGVTECVQ
ncbi:hypothetical protein COLO4_04664 [Corchorus olitorius]|uniref:Uncharacterized protein n=1 Tax=Corchorus olitorius TaxID=93759 RepID=A0A1R3KTA2_9ROSI|nr:hypothetical protein COLO4_04664 [Corchorus olitorius]